MSVMTERDYAISDDEAVKRLGDIPFALYAARVAAKMFWTLVCKRWPELRGMR